MASTAFVGLVALAVVAAACGDNEPGRSAGSLTLGEGTGGIYLALGDSIAAGEGASDPSTSSYVALVAEALRARFAIYAGGKPGSVEVRGGSVEA